MVSVKAILLQICGWEPASFNYSSDCVRISSHYCESYKE